MTIKFRLLDKITVTNFIDSKNEARIGIVNNEYYLLDDPSLYELNEVGEGYYTFKEEIPYRIYDFDDIRELYSVYINQQLSNTLNIFKVLLLFKEGKLSSEMLNTRLLAILNKHKDLPTDILIDLSNMLEELASKYPKQRIILDPSILEVVKYCLEMSKANKILENISIKELLLKVMVDTDDRVEFPATSDMIADIDQLIELLANRERKSKNKKKDKDKEEDKEEEITVNTDGSTGSKRHDSSDSSTSDQSTVTNNNNDNIGNSNSNNNNNDNSSNNNDNTSGSNNNINDIDSNISNNNPTSVDDFGTATDQTHHISLPYLKTFEVYTDKPFTQNDENEVARMIMNYMQLRDRKCRIHIR